MKTLTHLFWGAICLLLITSCNHDDLDTSIHSEVDQSETFQFIYKGVNYSSTYHFDRDSSIILHNTEINELYQKLKNLPELATYIQEDNSIEFFDTYEQAIEESDNRPTLRRERPFQPFQYIIVEFYDQLGYQGNSHIQGWDLSTSKSSHILGGNFAWNSINFDKKASSIQIKTYERGYVTKGYHYYLSYRVIFYNSYESQNQSIIFSKYPSDFNGNINVGDLRKYGWNKKIGTYTIILGYGGDYSLVSGGRDGDGTGSASGR